LITGCLDGGADVPSYGDSLYNPERRGINSSEYKFFYTTWSVPDNVVLPTDFVSRTGAEEGVETTVEVEVPEPVGVSIHRFDNSDAFNQEADVFRVDPNTGEEREPVETVGEYNVYHIEELYGAVDEQEMTLLVTEEFDVDTIEVTEETLSGDAEPFPRANDDALQLVDAVGEGDIVRGMMTPPSDSGLSGSAFGVRISMNDEMMDLRYAHVYGENAETDELASLVENDLGEDGNVVDSSVNGRVAAVDARAEVVEDTEGIPID